MATIQDGLILALLAGTNGQEFAIDIINPFAASVEAAVLAALQL